MVAGVLVLALLILVWVIPEPVADRDGRARAESRQAGEGVLAPEPAVDRVAKLVAQPPSAVAPPDTATLSKPAYVIREERRTITPTLARLGRDFETRPFSEMEFPLFDGESLRLTDLRHTRIDRNSGVFTGKVKGEPGSHVVLGYVGLAESGSIHRPATGDYYEVRTADESGASYLTKVDPSKVPPCATCLAQAAQP